MDVPTADYFTGSSSSDVLMSAAVADTSANQSRKRPRSPPPPVALTEIHNSNNNNNNSHRPTTTATTKSEKDDDDILRAERLINLETRNEELNDLLQISANHDVNFSMPSDAIPNALVQIVMQDCLQYHQNQHHNKHRITGSTNNSNHHGLIFRSKDAWKEPPTRETRDFANHCKTIQIDRRPDGMVLPTLEVIAMILRNLSFTGANLRLLAYSPHVLQVLTAFLYIGSHHDSGETLILAALQTLLHLVRYLDVTGQQILCDKLFYDGVSGPPVPQIHTYNRAVTWGGMGASWLAKRLDVREDIVEKVSTQFLLEFCGDYLVAVWSIFPVLQYVLIQEDATRSVLLLALDLLHEFISAARVGLVGAVEDENPHIRPGQDYPIPKLRAVLVNMPEIMLERLVNLLYVPRLGSDSLEYIDPVHNIVTRVTTLKLLMGYDATVDTDARDRALDVLVPLLELDSPRMAARLGRVEKGGTLLRTRLYDALVPILTTTVGRNEASVLATQLFRELAQASEENRAGLQFVQSRLVELASRDPRVSLLVWNELYPPSDDEEENGDVIQTN